jgi:hypothetical protein
MPREQQTENRRIMAEHLECWFSEAKAKEGKRSYQQHLLAGGLKGVELETVKKLYGRQLEGQMMDWAITSALLVVMK